jgi:hypothetical protein
MAATLEGLEKNVEILKRCQQKINTLRPVPLDVTGGLGTVLDQLVEEVGGPVFDAFLDDVGSVRECYEHGLTAAKTTLLESWKGATDLEALYERHLADCDMEADAVLERV